MIISIIIGLCIWLALPLLFDGKLKKNQRRAISMVCKIIGIVIIVLAIIRHLI